MAQPQPTFRFPIPPQKGNQNLKSIPSTILPKFYDLISEDRETILFRFDIFYKSYDYATNAYKMKFSPSTIKEACLRWFMGEKFIYYKV